MNTTPLTEAWRRLTRIHPGSVTEQALVEALTKAIEIIETHNMCHDLHGKVGAAEFAAGCAAEQRKLFGCAPDADRVEELEGERQD